MTEQLVYGIHAVSALLNSPHRTIYKLFLQERVDKRLQQLLERAEKQQICIERLDLRQMSQRFEQLSHQGVVASASPLPEYTEADLETLLNAHKNPLVLILDGITDPHNLGACLRSADAAGVAFVLIPKDKNARVTPVVSKVASGAAEFIPLVRVTNLVRSMEFLKKQGIWIYGAAEEAERSVYQIDCTSATALVVGAEGDGLRQLTRKHCDALFSLPMFGSVESLNVSVATGVALYEVIRQRVMA